MQESSGIGCGIYDFILCISFRHRVSDDFWTIIRGSAKDMAYGLAGFRRCYTLLLTYFLVLLGEGYHILAGGCLFRIPFYLMLIFLPLYGYSVSYITAESV